MNIFKIVSEKVVTQDLYRHTRYREFVWREAVPSPIQVTPSIQEQYTSAIIGPPSIQDNFITKERIRYLIRNRYHGIDEATNAEEFSIQIWLLCNEYTQAKLNLQILHKEFKITYREDTENIHDYIVKQSILQSVYR